MKKQLAQKINDKVMEILNNFLITYKLAYYLKFIWWVGANFLDSNLKAYIYIYDILEARLSF